MVLSPVYDRMQEQTFMLAQGQVNGHNVSNENVTCPKEPSLFLIL